MTPKSFVVVTKPSGTLFIWSASNAACEESYEPRRMNTHPGLNHYAVLIARFQLKMVSHTPPIPGGSCLCVVNSDIELWVFVTYRVSG